MTGDHPSEATLERMARRELDPDAFLAVAKHLESCPACAAIARRRTAQDLGALRRELTAPPRRSRIVRRIAAAAAVAAALLLALVVTRDDPAPPVVPRSTRVTPPVPAAKPAQSPPVPRLAYADADWQGLVEQTLASGELPFRDDLAEVRVSRDVVRGQGGESQRVSLSPADSVVADARPAFHWPARPSKSYVVYVFDGEREIARSPELRETSWRPAGDLPRGRTLTWQVEAGRGDEVETIPRPPVPPARFRIVSEQDRRAIERARSLHPDDALLHAALYARAGLRDEALNALRRVARTDATAKILEHYAERP